MEPTSFGPVYYPQSNLSQTNNLPQKKVYGTWMDNIENMTMDEIDQKMQEDMVRRHGPRSKMDCYLISHHNYTRQELEEFIRPMYEENIEAYDNTPEGQEEKRIDEIISRKYDERARSGKDPLTIRVGDRYVSKRGRIRLTRDYSNFPFPLVEVTREDRIANYYFHVKFQTPHYVAYVSETMQNYIKPEHLYREEESFAMKEARRCVWGGPLVTGKERYDIQKNYPEEYARVHAEEDELFAQDLRDHDPDMSKACSRIREKYTWQNYLWRGAVALANENKLSVIALVATSAIAYTVFFCSSQMQR